jgi:hypothetical protein
MRIVETGNAQFFESAEVSGSSPTRNVVVDEIRVDLPVDTIVPNVVDTPNDIGHLSDHPPNNDDPISEVPLRRSHRERKSAIPDDYLVYQIDSASDVGICKDPISYSQAIKSADSDKWIDAMNEELQSMDQNQVWDLVNLPSGHKAVGSKWIFKTKLDKDGKIERFKARLVAKGFTQKEGIDYKETFSPVSKKDSLRIILSLVAHYDLELHQMDVRTAFLNGELEEEVYMKQLEDFILNEQENLVCKLKKSIYGLKHASRQWFF